MLNKIIQQARSDWKYHFFIFYSSAIFPLNFSKHFRIVTVNKQTTHRREIGHFKNKNNPKLWYLHIDFLNPIIWLKKFLWKTNKHRESHLAYHETWKENSLAHKAVSFVENSPHKYPYINKYILFPWPNSNTYLQRILNNFPQIKFKLPRNAFGKNYRLK